MRVVLASASPRRRELLSLLVSSFEVEPTDIDESILESEGPADYVERLAREKARAHPSTDAVIVAADTAVALDDVILGKPTDRHDARCILNRLSSNEHAVYTAVAVRCGSVLRGQCVRAAVTFTALSEHLIEAYLNTDEPWDKAGAYGIQGFAGSFVSQLQGSYSAVVGLPLLETRELLERFGILPDWPGSPRG